MRDLSGVVLTLQHQYEVIGERRKEQLNTVWRGSLRGFDIPVDIVVLDGLQTLVTLPPARRGVAQRIAAQVETGSRVRSPHLLRVLDYGEFEDGTPFFVTDQSGGTTLADVIGAQGRLPLSGTVQLIGEVARGLAALHATGLGHLAVCARHVSFCDLPGATVTVLGGMGMGLLRHEVTFASEPADVTHLAPATDASQTASRQWQAALRGRDDGGEWETDAPTQGPAPISPGPGDPVAFDVFGLAVLTYRCLTGRHPFLDESHLSGDGVANALVRLDTAEPMPPQEHGVDLAADVWQVLRSGLARDPGARPPGALAFAEALESAAAAGRVAPAPEPAATPRTEEALAPTLQSTASRPGPAPLPWLGIAIVVLAVTNLATLLVLFQGGKPPVVATEPPGAVWISPVDIGPDGQMPASDSDGAPAAQRGGRALTRPGSWRIHSPGSEPVELVWDGDKITLRLVKNR